MAVVFPLVPVIAMRGQGASQKAIVCYRKALSGMQESGKDGDESEQWLLSQMKARINTLSRLLSITEDGLTDTGK